jgi:hypothetical protein
MVVPKMAKDHTDSMKDSLQMLFNIMMIIIINNNYLLLFVNVNKLIISCPKKNSKKEKPVVVCDFFS